MKEIVDNILKKTSFERSDCRRLRLILSNQMELPSEWINNCFCDVSSRNEFVEYFKKNYKDEGNS